MYERIRADVDLNAAIDNMKAMKTLLPDKTQMYAVIKADGYGHGALPIANALCTLPFLRGFCVATVEEGIALREHGITKQLLLLGFTFPEEADEIVRYDLTPTVFTTEMAKSLSDAAKKADKCLPVHLAIDTGMSRIGIQTDEEGIEIAKEIAKMPNLSIEGAFTHFAKADEEDKSAARLQYLDFTKMLCRLKEEGIEIEISHCANSAAILDLSEMSLHAVRAGITLYGLRPSCDVFMERIPLKPLMTLKTRISHIKTLPAGREISYGGTYRLQKAERIATIPVGYADGYPRSLSNRGYVLIHGKKAPIRGRVCMDQFMVDVTHIPEAKVGDAVTLIGKDGLEELSMDTLGDLSGRFNYELACDLGKRVPRIYHLDGAVVHSSSYHSY